MLWNEKRHWQAFNIGGRAFGCGLIIVGALFSFWGLSLLLDSKATIDVDGVPTTDPWIKAMLLIMGLGGFVLGLLMIFARRFRPDLGDPAFTDSKKISAAKLEKHDHVA